MVSAILGRCKVEVSVVTRITADGVGRESVSDAAERVVPHGHAAADRGGHGHAVRGHHDGPLGARDVGPREAEGDPQHDAAVGAGVAAGRQGWQDCVRAQHQDRARPRPSLRVPHPHARRDLDPLCISNR